jgi:peroxiredoxin
VKVAHSRRTRSHPRPLGRADFIGRRLPPVALSLFPEGSFQLDELAKHFDLVLCFYERLAPTAIDETLEETRRALAWTEHEPTLRDAGYRLVSISTDPVAAQAGWIACLEPHWIVLSDSPALLARTLPLRTTVSGRDLVYDPATLAVRRRRIVGAWQPAHADDALQVTAWVTQ